MELRKIEESDLAGKGVRGQADVPGLSAEEMQEKIEEIARFAIEKINEIIEYLAQNGASKEDLQNLLIKAGSVSSVFGRAGDVKPLKGDYTAEMVGAAKEKHGEQHRANGTDPITPEDIGAAKAEHTHGSISSDGKIGSANGMLLVTGLGGKIEAQAKENIGFLLPPAVKSINGAFTAEDNIIYQGSGIGDFIFSCDEEKKASCHGWVTFGTRGNISMSGFDFIEDPEDIASAEEGSRWEFDLEQGCLIVRKRSE
ncbi:MAG: hypothetical protein IJ945_04010 [Oscillospiraceae bacterium]|nr:hypothetical protein [Oscillospiraceae bacterium]